MTALFSLAFSDRNGDHSLELKKVDHQAANVITIDKVNYKYEGVDEAIDCLRSHLHTNKFQDAHHFTASLKGDLETEKKESVVFQKKVILPEAISAIQSKLMEMAKEDKFSGTLLIARPNSPPFISESIGFANIESGQKNSLNTQYNIASMSKMFTTVGILQLMEKGKLSLDDPISNYLSDEITNEAMGKVTIRQLLSHSSTVGRIDGPFRTISEPREFIKYKVKPAPSFEPDSKRKYSNYGFILLGVIIEKITGEKYYHYVQENIFDVAKMTDSNYKKKTELTENVAVGYIKTKGKLVNNLDTLPLRGTPAGCAYSTAPDLLRFSNALLKSGVLLEASSLELIKTRLPQLPNELKPSEHTTGFMTGDHWFGHPGRYDGANGELRIYQSGYIVIALANRFNPDQPDQEQASGLANSIEKILF